MKDDRNPGSVVPRQRLTLKMPPAAPIPPRHKNRPAPIALPYEDREPNMHSQHETASTSDSSKAMNWNLFQCCERCFSGAKKKTHVALHGEYEAQQSTHGKGSWSEQQLGAAHNIATSSTSFELTTQLPSRIKEPSPPMEQSPSCPVRPTPSTKRSPLSPPSPLFPPSTQPPSLPAKHCSALLAKQMGDVESGGPTDRYPLEIFERPSGARSIPLVREVTSKACRSHASSDKKALASSRWSLSHPVPAEPMSPYQDMGLESYRPLSVVPQVPKWLRYPHLEWFQPEALHFNNEKPPSSQTMRWAQDAQKQGRREHVLADRDREAINFANAAAAALDKTPEHVGDAVDTKPPVWSWMWSMGGGEKNVAADSQPAPKRATNYIPSYRQQTSKNGDTTPAGIEAGNNKRLLDA